MNTLTVSMSFYHLNATLRIHEVDRLKDEVLNDFFFAGVLQCCAGLWPLYANKSREGRDYKHFLMRLISRLRAMPFDRHALISRPDTFFNTVMAVSVSVGVLLKLFSHMKVVTLLLSSIC